MAKQIYIPRRLERVIQEASKYFSVISVTGPRQSGKSTMLKHLFPDLPKFSMKVWSASSTGLIKARKAMCSSTVTATGRRWISWSKSKDN